MNWPNAGTARLAACLMAAAALMSCSGPVVTAVGSSNDIVVIRDADAAKLGDLAVAALEGPSTWLLDEPAFKTAITTMENSGDLKNIRHVLLVGTWSGGETGRMIRQVFPGLRESDRPGLHLTEDVWAKRQVVGAVIGANADAVAAYLTDNATSIRDRMETAALDRLTAELRATAVEAGMAEAMAERFGWSLSPPTGYELFTTNEADGFVFFRRTRPDRTIFVYWTEGDPSFVSEQFALAKRDEIAGLYFDGDAIEWKRPVEAERIEFLGRPAVRLSGWWGNRTLVGGGPFRTYCFHDPDTGRVYLLDASLFAPSFDKTALMRNLDAIARTFTFGA
jgi:hypothetical protein